MTDDSGAATTDRASDRVRPYSSNDYRLARFGWRYLIPIVDVAYRVRVIGLDNVPDGAAILAANHVSYVDPIVLWGSSPRFVHVAAKAELWNVPFVRWVIDKVGAIPVHRDQVDRTFLQTTTRLLKEGNIIGIFPEGTRNRAEGLGESNDGVAFLAMRADAPVLPVGLAGTNKIMPDGAHIPRFPRVTIVIGKPIYPENFTQGSRKERMSAFTAAIMAGIERELALAEKRPDAS